MINNVAILHNSYSKVIMDVMGLALNCHLFSDVVTALYCTLVLTVL